MFRMLYNDYLISYILLLMIIHSIYIFYVISFILNSISISNGNGHGHGYGYGYGHGHDTISNTTFIYTGNIVIVDSISRIHFNTTF